MVNVPRVATVAGRGSFVKGENRRVSLTRRELLESAGASVAVAAVDPGGAFAQRPDGPNVLVIVIDTLRADHVGAYGGRALTPNIDALAREGLRFTRCHPEAMATVPARRSILTGRRVFPFRNWRPERHLVNTPGWASIADVDATFTSVLRRAGWWTGYVTDNPFLGFASGYEPLRSSYHEFVRIPGQLGRIRRPRAVSRRELDHWLVPELRHPGIEHRVRDFLASSGGYWENEAKSWAARVFTAAAATIATAARRRPFALVVDSYEPHEPWTPPRGYIDMYGDREYRGPEPSTARYARVTEYLKRDRREGVLGRMRDVYAAEVTMTDRWLAALLEALVAHRLERETVVVLVSDHGYLLGEHGWTGKVASMLQPTLTHVPLILVDPARRGAGATTDWFAQTHDIAPTLLELTGLRRAAPMNGLSLAPLLWGGPARASRPMAYGGYANWHYARTDRWTYVGANTGKGRRLYDVRSDPGEFNNIARQHPDVIDEFEETVREQAGGLPSYDERGRLRRR
jgi:arylsulfatase A-like enzyme